MFNTKGKAIEEEEERDVWPLRLPGKQNKTKLFSGILAHLKTTKVFLLLQVIHTFLWTQKWSPLCCWDEERKARTKLRYKSEHRWDGWYSHMRLHLEYSCVMSVHIHIRETQHMDKRACCWNTAGKSCLCEHDYLQVSGINVCIC